MFSSGRISGGPRSKRRTRTWGTVRTHSTDAQYAQYAQFERHAQLLQAQADCLDALDRHHLLFGTTEIQSQVHADKCWMPLAWQLRGDKTSVGNSGWRSGSAIHKLVNRRSLGCSRDGKDGASGRKVSAPGMANFCARMTDFQFSWTERSSFYCAAVPCKTMPSVSVFPP